MPLEMDSTPGGGWGARILGSRGACVTAQATSKEASSRRTLCRRYKMETGRPAHGPACRAFGYNSSAEVTHETLAFLTCACLLPGRHALGLRRSFLRKMET